MKIRNIVLIFTLIAVIISCRKEVIDLDKKTDTLEFQKSLVGPIVNGTFLLSDITDEVDGTDTEVLVIDGDTVKLHIIRDSLFNYSTADLVLIPLQSTATYHIEPETEIQVASLDNVFDTLITDTVFTLTLRNSMRLDSMIVGAGTINVNAVNTFNYDVSLNLFSDSIISPSGNALNETIIIQSGASASFNPIDLSGHKIIFGHNDKAVTTVKMKLTPNFDKNSGSGNLFPGEYIDVVFNVSDMNDFDIVYGFMGYQSYLHDTVIDIIVEGMEEELKHIDGTFQATNPKIWLNYEQSFGVPLGTDVDMNIYHHNAPNALIDLNPRIIPALQNPNDLPIVGSIIFSNVDNINELLTFPIADSVHVNGLISTNLGLDSVTTKNFVSRNSEMLLGLDIEIPLEFRADLTYCDTLDFNISGDLDENDQFEFEYLNLHSFFTNTFPISFDAMLLFYNEDLGQVIDSININSFSDEPYLMAAPVDANGIVILNQVEEKHAITKLDNETANNLLFETTHLIVKAKIRSYNNTSVKILHTSKLDFQFAIEAKGKIKTEL